MSPRLPHRLAHRAATALLALALAACGGGAGEPGPAPEPAAELALPARAVVRLQVDDGPAGGWIALAERPLRLAEHHAPDRELLVGQAFAAAPRRHAAPAGWSLLDAVRHGSGEISVLLSDSTRLRLQRLAADGQLLFDEVFEDPQAASDPFIGSFEAPPLTGLAPRGTRDAARLAAQGEDLALAYRHGRNAVVAHGLGRGAAGFTRRWRRLVEPGTGIGWVGLSSGVFDPFDSVQQQWQLHLAALPDGGLAVAVTLAYTELAEAHAQHFGEAPDPGLLNGLLLTRLAADGRRLGTTAIATAQRLELYALRATAERLALAGRIRTSARPDGGGWDAWLAAVDARDGRLQWQRSLDLDRSDVIFDARPLPGGRWLLAGATGYVQNPTGRSISEEARSWIALLPDDHGAPRPLALPQGPRHNQARALAGSGERWWVAGMVDGPGTHSADADPARLSADGFVRRVDWPPG